MEYIQYILTQYSPVEIVIIILFLLIGTKAISALIEWFYNKLKSYFSNKDHEEKELYELKTEQDSIEDRLDKIDDSLIAISDQIKLLTERLQENTKSYIIDKHHHFCYQVKAIDDLSLQSLELRYMYYKAAGGDSYIDNLMAEIRELPKVDMQTLQLSDIMKGESNGSSGT